MSGRTWMLVLAIVPAFMVGCESTPGTRSGVSARDLGATIEGMGEPIAFEHAFADVRTIPRFKDEFETAAAFEARQATALADIDDLYLISSAVDPEHIEYDAEKQVLLVSVYALQNGTVNREELGATLGIMSELQEHDVSIEYVSYTSKVAWLFSRERRHVGTYRGQNAFGVAVTITEQAIRTQGIFERTGRGGFGSLANSENLWFRHEPAYKKGSPPIAFRLGADPDRAKLLKREGALRAGVLFSPHRPFFATGVHRDTPTLDSPYDRRTSVELLIGDIIGVALYDADGTRKTQ